MGFWFFIVTLLVVPTLLVAWALLHEKWADHVAVVERRARIAVLGLIAILTQAVLAYHAIVRGGLGQTSALFILIPALLAVAAVFVPTQSAKGVACKSVTVGLLVGLVFLGEGMLCIFMSAPLFYLVAILIGAAIDEMDNADRNRRILSCLALFSVLPMSLEGVTPRTTFTRDTVVSETRIIPARLDEVAAAVERHPRFDRPLPKWLTLGFPRPITSAMNGDTLHVQMRGGEMRLDGLEPRVGTLVLQREPGEVNARHWRAISDDSHMRHFLTWQSSEVRWHAIDERHTEVTWTIRYRRDLDPAWYFAPLERVAVQLAAGYLIDAVATP